MSSRAVMTRIATLPISRMASGQLRTLTSTRCQERTAKEAVKDSLKTVDRAVSDKIVDGIDMATAATHKVADKLSHHSTAEQAAGKAEQMKGQAKEKAGQAKEKTGEMKDQAKEKTDQMKEKLNDAAEGMWEKF